MNREALISNTSLACACGTDPWGSGPLLMAPGSAGGLARACPVAVRPAGSGRGPQLGGQHADSAAAHSRSVGTADPESEPVMRQVNLLVDGMSCRHCVREVTARLRDVPGVETVSASARDSRVRVSGSMQLADVVAAFIGTAYRPRLESPSRDHMSSQSSDGSGDGIDVGRADGGGDSGGTAVGKSTP